MIALYLDENIHGAVIEGLRAQGFDILTPLEDGFSGKPDTIILDRATELGRVVLTYDDDFTREANHRQASGIPFGGVIYAHYLSIGQQIQGLLNLSARFDTKGLEQKMFYLSNFV